MSDKFHLNPQPKLNCNAIKNNSVKYILKMIDSNRLDFDPPYQREGDIWPNERKRLFINSILANYDIPKIYFHRLSIDDVRKTNHKFSIIDGKQRLHTIKLFAKNNLKLDENTVWNHNNKVIDVKDMTYSDLLSNYPKIAARFMNCELPIISVTTNNADDELDVISELFLRLNKGMSTNSAEKRNAMVNSDVIKHIKNLTKHKFFTKKINISSKRYKHEDIICKFLFFEYHITNNNLPSTNRSNLDDFTKYFIDNDLNKKYKENVCKILNEMSLVFCDKDELLKRQTIIPIYYLLFHFMNGKVKPNIRKDIIQFVKDVEKNRDVMNSLERETRNSEIKADLIDYYVESLQGTNRSSSIKKRCCILADHLGIKIPEIETWPSKLYFENDH